MDDQEFYDTLEMFNFGQKTGVDLPAESAGILPKPKNWDAATHGSMGYGYGTSVTAIQMAAAVSAIARPYSQGFTIAAVGAYRAQTASSEIFGSSFLSSSFPITLTP